MYDKEQPQPQENSYFSTFSSFISNLGSLGSAANTMESSSSKALKALSDKRTFERIIEAINGNTYVYSNSLVKSYSGLDGTLVWEYIKELDDVNIDFEGQLTDEQSAAAGLQREKGDLTKVTLLRYLVNYCHNNKDKFERDKLEMMVEILVRKGAEFDLDIYEKCMGLGVDISKTWAVANEIDLSSCSSQDILDVQISSELIRPVLYSFFCNKPINEIFPGILGDARLDDHIELFYKAMEKRLALVSSDLESSKQEAKKELKTDLTASVLAGAIVADANINKSIENQTAEISKLTYAISASHLRITADALLRSEQELLKLLEKKNVKCSEIQRIESIVAASHADIIRDKQKVEQDAKDLVTKKQEFTSKWGENKDPNMAAERLLEKNSDAQTILLNQQSNANFLVQLGKKEESLKLSEATLEGERNRVKMLDEQIYVAESQAIVIANRYKVLVGEQQETYESNNNNKLFGSPKCQRMQYQDLSKAEAGDIRRLFCQSCVYSEQKKRLFFALVQAQKWDCIHPLFQNGISLEGATSKNGEAVMQFIAMRYMAGTPQEIILMLAHTSPEAMRAIVSSKSSIHGCGITSFLQTSVYTYMVNKDEQHSNSNAK